MLVRLTPDQVSDFWAVLEGYIEGALPPVVGDNQDRMKNILVSVLSGTMDCWASFSRDKSTGISVNGVVVTTIIHEENSGTKDLMIYAVYGIESMLRGTWEEGYAALAKWAKVNGCSRITGYTNVDSIIRTVRRFGGTADQTFITVPVN